MPISNAEMTWMLINRAADLLRSDFIRHDEEELDGITVSQQNVLGAIYVHNNTGVMVKDIATNLNITRGAASQAVESLVQRGLLKRSHSERDRRAVFVQATEKGAKIRKRLSDRLNPIIEGILSDINVTNRESFLEVLKILVERLTEMNTASKSGKSSRQCVSTSQAEE